MLSPFGSADPFNVAPLAVTEVAADVVTSGAVGVENETTAPNEVLTEFAAIAQTK